MDGVIRGADGHVFELDRTVRSVHPLRVECGALEAVFWLPKPCESAANRIYSANGSANCGRLPRWADALADASSFASILVIPALSIFLPALGVGARRSFCRVRLRCGSRSKIGFRSPAEWLTGSPLSADASNLYRVPCRKVWTELQLGIPC